MPGAHRPSPAARPPPAALRSLCAWLDQLPLSRPKRHLARDFSDGVLVAEVVKHFHPRLVDLHSYVPACSTDQKLSNWSLLNRKVFHKLHLCVPEEDIHKVVANSPGAIEPILCALREKMEAGAVHAGSRGGTAHRPHTGQAFSSSDAVQPWAGLDAHPQAVLPSPPAPPSTKACQSRRALEKTGSCACGRGDSAEAAWEHLARAQQLLADKEQALGILQETVQESDVIVWVWICHLTAERKPRGAVQWPPLRPFTALRSAVPLARADRCIKPRRSATREEAARPGSGSTRRSAVCQVAAESAGYTRVTDPRGPRAVLGPGQGPDTP